MPNRTDDPSQTHSPLADVPVSPVAASPQPSPSLQTTDDGLPTYESFRAICSSNQRGGHWEPADEIQVRAICGEVVLDFTRAELPPSGTIEIDAWAIGGEVKIIVPDGAEVELEGTPFCGSIEHQVVREEGERNGIRERATEERNEDLPAPAPPPYFRIDGRAIFGAIKVTGG